MVIVLSPPNKNGGLIINITAPKQINKLWNLFLSNFSPNIRYAKNYDHMVLVWSIIILSAIGIERIAIKYKGAESIKNIPYITSVTVFPLG